MSNPTANFGWVMPTSTDLVTDLPADFAVFGQAVDTSLADLKGGTTGQVLKKNSNTDMDFVWSADSAGMTNPMTTTGDTIYSSSGSTPARLGIGSSGQVLTVSGGVPTWATPSGSAVVQVKSMTTTASTSVASGNSADTNLTLSITPTSASNKILVLISQSLAIYRNASGGVDGTLNLYRGTTDLGRVGIGSWKNFTVSAGIGLTLATVGASYLDSPATTSAITYKTQLTVGTGGTIDTDGQQSITLIEVTP